MKKILILITIITGLAIASCTTEPGAISTTYLTNYVALVITNTPDHVVDVDLMNAVRGEWLVTLDTSIDYTNGYDGDSNVIYLPYVLTNSYDSITNGGYDGAYSFVFKADFTVDKNVYNSQGTLLTAFTNAYIYSILSNEFGFRIDMTIAGYHTETHYIQPEGPLIDLVDPITNIVTMTNFDSMGSIEDIFNETNEDYQVVSPTNSWLHVIEVADTIDSFNFAYSIVSDVTNMTWTPDMNYYTVLNNTANSLSQRYESHDIYIDLNGDNSSDSMAVYFQFNDADSFKLKKIK